jgi:hypothetical protein
MRRWQQLAVAAAVVAALVAYQRHQDEQARQEALIARLAATEAREQEQAQFDQEASCIAIALQRGAQPATAVNGCLGAGHTDLAVWLSSCLENAAEAHRGVMTALDVDYYWTDCAHEEQLRDEMSG